MICSRKKYILHIYTYLKSLLRCWMKARHNLVLLKFILLLKKKLLAAGDATYLVSCITASALLNQIFCDVASLLNHTLLYLLCQEWHLDWNNLTLISNVYYVIIKKKDVFLISCEHVHVMTFSFDNVDNGHFVFSYILFFQAFI